MRRLHGFRIVVVVATTTFGLVGCSLARTRDKNTVKTAEELAASLLTDEDLEGEWKLNPGPDGASLPASGVITDAVRGMLPRVEVCEKTNQTARDALDKLQWQAFRQLDKTVDNPIKPPADRAGHMEFVQQWAVSGEPDELESMFDDIAPGFLDCLGEVPAGEEGPATISEVDIDPVGDQRVAVLAQIEEAGGGGMWNVYSTLVRSHSVLMSVTMVDITLGDLDAELGVSDLDAVLSAALSKF